MKRQLLDRNGSWHNELATYEALGILLADCDDFLQRWGAYIPKQSLSSPDAILAITELRERVIERRRELLLQLDQLTLPF